MFRQTSRTDTVSTSSVRTYLISEASSVLPSLSVSAFSLNIAEAPSSPHSANSEVFLPSRFEEGLSSSCKEGLDILDDPAYTDTVKSNDSTGSMLRRSLSMPPQYTYKTGGRRHAREVFEDFMVPEQPKKAESIEEAEQEDQDKPWRQTMEDLLERPDYIDSLQSTSSGAALLAKTATTITKSGQETKLIKEEHDTEAQRKKAECRLYTKNLIVLSIVCFFLFGAYLSLRNLQSSINEDSGLAFYSLSALYLCFFLGCILATTVIQYLRPKRTMVLAHVLFLLYVGANFYPTYYTLLPASILQGFVLSNFWTAHSTYLASIGLSYAQVLGKNPLAVLTKFNGIFFAFFGISQVLGNVISSTVLMSVMKEGFDADDVVMGEFNSSSYGIYNETNMMNLLMTNNNDNNMSTRISDLQAQSCGAHYVSVESVKAGKPIDRHIVYILLSIFAAMITLSMLIAFFFLDPLEGEAKKPNKSMCQQLAAVFRWFIDFRAICLVGLMVYSLLQMAFIFGEFTKAFVTCPIGVHMVGYAMVSLSGCSSASSYFSGKFTKLLGRPTVITLACLIQLSGLAYMLIWDPISNNTIIVLLSFMGIWGLADGILITQVVSIVGALFVDNKESAFAAVKMCQSIGACITLASAKYISFHNKICIIMGFLAIALVTYLMLEFSLWRESKAEVAGKVTEKKDKDAPTDV